MRDSEWRSKSNTVGDIQPCDDTMYGVGFGVAALRVLWRGL